MTESLLSNPLLGALVASLVTGAVGVVVGAIADRSLSGAANDATRPATDTGAASAR